MSEGKYNDLLNEIRTFPKPEMEKKVQNQMWLDIQKFHSKSQNRKRWENYMKKTYVGIVTAAAVLTLSLLTYNVISEDNSNKGRENTASPTEPNSFDKNPAVEYSNKTNTIDPVNQKLGEHQVAIDDLYFEIPMTKDKVYTDKRIENEFTMVDIRDKASNNLLFRYGETIGDSAEKEVFREVQTENGTVRMHVFLEINRDNATIENIKNTSVEVVKSTLPLEDVHKYGYSRSDKFPAEKIEVMVRGAFHLPTDVVDFYQGYTLSVVPK